MQISHEPRSGSRKLAQSPEERAIIGIAGSQVLQAQQHGRKRSRHYGALFIAGKKRQSRRSGLFQRLMRRARYRQNADIPLALEQLSGAHGLGSLART